MIIPIKKIILEGIILEISAQRDNTLVQQRDLQKKIANTTKINHSRFIVGKENYDKFNLNGEQIKWKYQLNKFF